MKVLRLIILMLAAYSLNSCQSDPWAWQYARSKPTQPVEGTYKLTSRSHVLLANMYKNAKTSQLELKPDGTFYIEDIASAWSPFPRAVGFESVRGNWRVGSNQDSWVVQLNVTSVKQADGQLNRHGYETYAMLIGQEAPYILHFGIGDPDSGDALQYERQ
ncbi:MAG: hypothetical protein ACRYF0_11875 [Janthinobacterium lividum]